MSDLMSFIADMDYICFNVEKSGDSRCCSRSRERWRNFRTKFGLGDNAAECDYMFVPRGDE